MADVFSKKKRSAIMSNVKGRGNEATELRLVRILRAGHISGWRRGVPLYGNPDFVFRREKVALFVDGCFWHGCPEHGECPATNRSFWRRKLERNVARDRLVNRSLRRQGWKVVRIWQHELGDPARVARRVAGALGAGKGQARKG